MPRLYVTNKPKNFNYPPTFPSPWTEWLSQLALSFIALMSLAVCPLPHLVFFCYCLTFYTIRCMSVCVKALWKIAWVWEGDQSQLWARGLKLGGKVGSKGPHHPWVSSEKWLTNVKFVWNKKVLEESGAVYIFSNRRSLKNGLFGTQKPAENFHTNSQKINQTSVLQPIRWRINPAWLGYRMGVWVLWNYGHAPHYSLKSLLSIWNCFLQVAPWRWWWYHHFLPTSNVFSHLKTLH